MADSHEHTDHDRHFDHDPHHSTHSIGPNHHHSTDGAHGLGETEEQHALHSATPAQKTWGLNTTQETILFYFWMATSLCCLVVAAAVAPRHHTSSHPFIAMMTAFMVLHWAGWLQTATGMAQRASWVRDEGDLQTRREYLYLAVRLNRLMLVSSSSFSTFISVSSRANTSLLAHGSCRSCDLLPSVRSPTSSARPSILAAVPACLHLECRFLRDERVQ